ncbi:MAG TPA: hypothetical protein VGI82_12255 [Chitinophagaceae bacterium]
MKIFEWLIKALFRLQAFGASFILFGAIAIFIYTKNANISLAIIFLVLGFILGVIVAESIRRKYGLESFFAKIYGSCETKKQVEPPK